MAQNARFAATAWVGPVLLLGSVAALQAGGLLGLLGMFALAIAGVVMLAFAFDASGAGKRDRPADLVLDDLGLRIEGGPNDGTQLAWADVHAAGCAIVEAEPRTSVRWWFAAALTARRVVWIARRVRVPVHHLQLPCTTGKREPYVLAEGEGDELESLEQLRDSIHAAAPDRVTLPAPAPLAQELLKCPRCGAPQVPAATPTMKCASCAHELGVPAELHERLRAQAMLEQTSAPSARVIARLVAQPGGRRAARIVAWCRRAMFWIQPLALTALIVMMVHQTGNMPSIESTVLWRTAPGDDGLLLYDVCLLALVGASIFGAAWTFGRAYVANRSALRVLVEGFGAVPPIAAGAPSTCRQCGAPLPATQNLLVHCVYCSAENVLGIDPRPAAVRRNRAHDDLVRGLRHRRRARLGFWIAAPICIGIPLVLLHEVAIAWRVPKYSDSTMSCMGPCGFVANDDLRPRAVVLREHDRVLRGTVLPRGRLGYECWSECSIEAGGKQVTVTRTGQNPDVHIKHGAVVPLVE